MSAEPIGPTVFRFGDPVQEATGRRIADGVEVRTVEEHKRARTLTGMLLALSAALDQSGIEWCVLSGYATYPEIVDPTGRSDVDLLVSREHFWDVPRVWARMPGVELVHSRRYTMSYFHYVLLSRTEEGTPVFLPVDVCCDIRGLGAVLLGPREVLAGRRRFEETFWIPEPSMEFIAYLLKKLSKVAVFGPHAFTERHGARLSVLYREHPEGCRQQLMRFLPVSDVGTITDAAECGRWGDVLRNAPKLCAAVRGKALRARPLDAVRCRIDDVHRRLLRIFQPAGLMVAFFGLDGSGKSSVIARVRKDLGSRCPFDVTYQYHIRPHTGGDRSGDAVISDPLPPRDLTGSLAQLVFWIEDFLVGYATQIFPRLAHSALVLFDRYYDDLLVDPHRYRYGGPIWLARLASRCVPRPAVAIFLDVPLEQLRLRKVGRPFRATAQQRAAYRATVGALRGGHVVDASGALDAVVADVEAIILGAMHERTTRRLGARVGPGVR